MKTELETIELLALCAFRYALGRRSYVVQEMCDTLKRITLSRNALTIMLRDLNEAVLRDDHMRETTPGGFAFPLGMDCDRQSWLDFRDFVRRRLEERCEGTVV